MLEISGTTIFGLFALVCFVIYLAFFSDSSSPGGGGSAGERSKADAADKAGGKNGGKAGAAQKKEAGPSGGKGGPLPKLDIFYGSQTGTAEGFARELAQGARSNNFDARAVDLENFTPDLIQECRAAVFLVATYGEGEPTDNSKAFVRWLKKGASAGDLDKLHYCVFGLGSTNYELYNTMGTLVDKKLEKFGGNRVLPLSLGDEARSMPEDWARFKRKCIEGFSKHFGVEFSKDSLLEVRASSKVTVYGSEAEARKACKLRSGSLLDAEGRNIIELRVSGVRELIPSGGKEHSCVHVELDDGGSGAIKYETGDHVGIFPENETSKVLELAEHVGIGLDTWISVEDENVESPFPCPCTLRDALTRYLDVSSLPNKTALRVLAEHASVPEEKNMLEGMAHSQGYALYDAFVQRELKGLVEVLRDCPSVRLPLSKLFEVCPRLQPRYYSISSASGTHPGSLHVTCSVVRKDVTRKRRFEGVCSGYLARLAVGDAVRCFTRSTGFKLPSKPSTPVILVGAGAGIAPLRAMMMELDHVRSSGAKIGQVMLIFGCRRKDEDYIYEDEVLEWSRNGTLSHVINAFSREGSEKVYVQHKIAERSFDVLSVLNSGACVYVCGAADMASEVRASFVDALVEHVKVSEDAAERFIDTIRSSGKYMQDVW